MRNTNVKLKIIFTCFAYFGMMGDVVGQIVKHDCPDFTKLGASQPSAAMGCSVWGNRITGLRVRNQDVDATWQTIIWCMCSKMVPTRAKLTCTDYNELNNTGMCQSVWMYGVAGNLYDKPISTAVYANPSSLAHELELCKQASKEYCEYNCKYEENTTPEKPSLPNGLTCTVQVAQKMPIKKTNPTVPVAPTMPNMMTNPTGQ